MRIALIWLLLATPVQAEVVLAARTLRPQTIVAPHDLVVKPGEVPGAFADPAPLIGLETRVAIYAGRPIHPGDVGPPSVVDRNQIVPMTFATGGLSIQAEGRALSRGGVGDRVRIMNLQSRTTVWGLVQPNGSIIVQ
ncbi:flagellar basal body P-ring formation chaperone FlgA [Thalassovita sp.]|uniref:flagellar basal body P-ring formation chaperone FlgA n=1 Tax=Thalassovita sp. TaxID=1979401 RepID=UPI0029DE609F|nr:flagellar basal body P-ring formation chaperone FlgA [Thalassovita sp.]